MTYTTRDFENAKFAEHPDGRIAARLYPDDSAPWADDGNGYTDCGMSQHGWTPVPVMPTITESEWADIKEAWSTEASIAWLRGFIKGGGEIIPDPEPTETEKLAADIRLLDFDCSLGDKELAKGLIERGWTLARTGENAGGGVRR